MIKGLSITPPVIGRIAIGKVVEKNGKRLPEKDDAFTITTQVQQKDGWLLHPLHQKLLAESPSAKIRAIPVTMLFNDPNLNLRAQYSLFERKSGRLLCVGNGENAKRSTPEGPKTVVCPSPEGCALGKELGCKPYGRLNVQIEGQEDDLGTFMFRTTGYNSIRTLAARLQYYHALSHGKTRFLPLSLKLRAKSTTQSHRAPVYYVDLVLREGLSFVEALPKAFETAQQAETAGIDFAAFEESARQGLSNGAFEESEEERPDVLAEFFPEVVSETTESEGVAVGKTEGDSKEATIIAAPNPPLESGRLESMPTRRVG
jgi:hypothetical protein